MSYKIVEINGKKAIVDENGKQISPLFSFIWEDGLVKGQSPYYVAAKVNIESVNIDGDLDIKTAIFDKDGNQISPEFKFIFPNGLVEGGKELYIAVREDGKCAVFNKDGEMISPEWFDFIYSIDFSEKEGNGLYIAVKNGEVAVFDEKGNQKTEWLKMGINIPEFNDKVTFVRIMSEIYFYQNEETKKSATSTIINWLNFKHHKDLGILEINDKQGNSIAIELEYKDDLDLKKGPSAPGI